MIDDVVQDAFVDLWEKRADFRGEYAVKAYLYKAVRNDCLNLMRHQQVEDKYARRVVIGGGGFRIIFGSDSGDRRFFKPYRMSLTNYPRRVKKFTR